VELRHLTGFLAVAEELHFGRAAQRLNMAQPPLSQQIRQLERELGVQLFVRTTRSVRLTSAGEAMLEPARTVLRGLDDVRRVARAGALGEIGRVTVGFAGASSHDLLPRLTRAVRARHPGIELVFSGQTYANEALDQVAVGRLDLGFVRLPATRRGVSTRAIGQETLIAALPAGHPSSQRREVRLRDLADDPFIAFPGQAGSSLRDLLVQTCREAGFSPRIVQEAPDSWTILALVAAGVGVTLTLDTVRHARTDGVVYLPLSGPQVRVQPALAWRTDDPSAALRAVLQVAEEVLPTPPD
jgi:DNA-binding transcriptional LysR family regulator